MADGPRCSKCGNDRIAEVVENGKALCRQCAGLPSIAEQMGTLKPLEFSRLQRAINKRFDRLEKEATK